MLIIIDGGTTNTRLSLLSGNKILKRIKANAGAGKADLSGNNEPLKNAVKNGISELLSDSNLKENEIKAVIASGMIGSELGLYNVPHISGPADIKKLSENMKKVIFDDISTIPFYFIPGVKFIGHDLTESDIMRGEETEFFGLDIKENESAVAVFPGTHTKLVMGENGEITNCVTSLSGEMLATLSQNTILKNSLPHPLSKNPDMEFAKKGYDFAAKNGINSALFKIRILKMFSDATNEQLCGFFTGAVISADINIIKNYENVIIGGSQPLKSVFAELTEYSSGRKPIILTEEEAETATVWGAKKIFEYNV